MTRLVACHQIHNVFQDRVGSGFSGGIEGRQGQALDHNLHTDKFQVPSWIRQNFIDDAIEMSVYRVHQTDPLLDVLIEHFNMPRLIKSLRCGIELCVKGGGTGTQLTGHQQRTLLTVKKLRE